MQNSKQLMAILWIFIGVIGRLLPHPPNMTPITSMGLFGGAKLSRRWAFAVSFVALVISDVLLGRLNGYPSFGAWSVFTYTGFAAVIAAGTWLKGSASAGRTLGMLLGSALFFWAWTNLGVWAVGGLYPHNWQGLGACYVAALPFLRNSLVGDLAWGLVFFAGFAGVRNLAAKRGFLVEAN